MIFHLRWSDIFCYAKCDIETCGFSDIIFAPNARRHITCEANITGAANITRRKANITENDKFLSKLVVFWRRERDSNPRAIARKLISSQPRYDHFDTAAYKLKQEIFLF